MSLYGSPWTIERETGRRYYHWQDSDGRTWLKYSDESEPRIAAYTAQPSIDSRTYETPRSGPSSRQSQKLYSNSQRDKQYYDVGGHETRYTSGAEQSTRGYGGTPYRDSGPAGWAQAQGTFSPDSLAGGVRKLTVTEYDDSYKTESSAFAQTQEGGYSTQYQSLPTTGSVAQSAVYENQQQAEQWQPAPQSYGERTRYQDKGKLVDPSSHRYIAGTGGQKEELDSSYRVRNTDWKTFFKVGRVFSTLWTEGTSARETDPNGTFLSNITIVAYKEKVHSKIRRFVVVREGDRCCSCLPVTTYDGRGYKKKGINLTEHGQVYAKSQPKTISGIARTPLRIKLSPGGRIDERLSLVHYGKVYTVETNVKVKDVGDLDSESRKLLRRYWKEVFVGNDDDIEDPLPMPSGTQADTLAGVGDSHTVPTYGDPASYSNHASDDTPRNTYTTSSDSRWSSASAYSSSNPTGQAPVENFEYSQQPGDPQYDYNDHYSTADNNASSYTQQLPIVDNYSRPVKHNNDEVVIEENNDQEDITLPTPQEIMKEENDRKQRKSTTSGKQGHEKHHKPKADRRR